MRSELMEIVAYRTDGINKKLESLKQRRLQAKSRIEEIDPEESELNAQLLRAKQFDPGADGGPFCPTCFIERGNNVLFRPIDADPQRHEINQFECSKCGSWMEVKP